MYSTKARKQVLAEFEACDLSAQAFCRRAGISRATLRSWQQDAAERREAPRSSSLFARVKLTPSSETSRPLEVHVGQARGLSATHVGAPDRRDRLLLLCALSQALLTLLGAACERTGLDQRLKANTSKKRTHSLFRQGLFWFTAIPTMRDEWFEDLMIAFEEILREHAHFAGLFATI